MIKLFYGDEPYKTKQLMTQILKSCQYPEMDYMQADSFNESVSAFAACSSFFGGNRVICLQLDELRADDHLLDFVKKGTPADVYIIARKVDQKTKIFSLLKKDSVKFSKLNYSDLKKFIAEKTSGFIFSPENMNFFVMHCGYMDCDSISLQTVEIYLEQLMLDADKKEITRQSILDFVPESPNAKVWNLFSHLAKKDLKSFLQEYMALEDNDIGILSAMLRSARIGYKASLCRRDGMKEKDIAEALNAVNAAFSFSVKLDPAVLFKMVEILQAAVNSIKSGNKSELVVISTAGKLAALF